GLVSHVGTLLLVANWPDEYGGMVRLIEQERLPVVEAEMEIFGATHSELGAYLLGLWGFNDSIVEAVAFHHNPDSCSGDVSGILLATHVAQHLLRVKRNPSVREDRFAQSIDQDFLNKLGGEDDMKRWEATYNLVSEEWPYDT
ncbi:MAG: HDOD domain-containing protein, partial [Rhodospirillaceae bacterium]